MLRNLAWIMIGVAAIGACVACPLGCAQKPTPATEFPRLGAGVEAIVYDKQEDRVAIHDIPEGRGVGGGMTLNFVTVGTKARVIEDSEQDREGWSGEDRHVRVVPLEGEMEGVPGVMFRKHLKAIGGR